MVRQDFTDYEVIIVDGGSTDGTLSLVSGYKIKLVKQNRRGFCNALNLGVKNASGEIIAFTDDDGVAHQNWLSSIVHTYEASNADVKAVGGLYVQNEQIGDYATMKWLQKNKFLKFFNKIITIIVYDNDIERIGHVYSSGATIGQEVNISRGQTVEVDFLGGCNMSFKKEVFEEMGLFDENLIEKGQFNEADLCLRFRKYHYKLLFNPEARVEHLKCEVGDSPRVHVRNFLYFYFKNLSPKKASAFLRFFVYLMFLSFCLEAGRFNLRGLR